MVDCLVDPDRYTFSSLMSLLIENESKLKGFYEETGGEVSQERLKSFLAESSKNSSKRMNLMQRARVERVVEMTLEPITGLKLADLITTINQTIQDRNLCNLEKTMRLELAVAKLYARASPRIMQTSSDTGELLLELSRESLERRHELEGYAGSAGGISESKHKES
jgi:hypothetical protein